MNIQFSIQYNTNWGEQILVAGNIPELGGGDFSRALKLNYTGNGRWQADVVVDDDVETVVYNYLFFSEEKGVYREEWGNKRVISVNKGVARLLCFDCWSDAGSLENVFTTSPFQRVWFKSELQPNPAVLNESTHLFQVKAPGLAPNEALCLLGSAASLGEWNQVNPIVMQYDGEHWFAEVNVECDSAEIYYKYGVYNVKNKKFLYFENRDNRIAPVANDSFIRMTDGFAQVGERNWRGTGVGIPVFSIRTKASFGVGDFVDLKALVDWTNLVGIRLIQLLPLNDTIGTLTELDVLPYAAISAFALNPLYLNLPALGQLPVNSPMRRDYKSKQEELNTQDLVPFMEVVRFKVDYAREAFRFQKEQFLKNPEFVDFFNKNSFWLTPYAAFCVQRDKFGTSDYSKWEELGVYNAAVVEKLTSVDSPLYNEVAFHYFMQFHLHKQLHEAGLYANEHGVVLKGDIPIGVNKNSVDTWINPELFHLDRSAGAPPDMFAVKGQNWALPSYNWDEMKRTSYKWWKQRFEHMTNYFDTFRIDHILGFFRIWEIPTVHVEGIMGRLNPSVPIYLHEFAANGVNFDYNRFCKPFITEQVLHDFFGADAHWVKAHCLEIEDGWKLRLKDEFSSQVNIERMINLGVIQKHLREPFMDLISNVLLFEVEGSNGTQFYPRYGLHFLSSFAELDDQSKQGLDRLYVDYFYKRQDVSWYHSGMEKLPALKRATNMLICGEDLGMMNPAVTAVMKELGILSLEVQRAPKSDEIEFAHPHYAPYLSVVTPSTHDMTTIREWWEEDRGVTQRFFNNQLGRSGEAPALCEWWVVRDIILQHLYSPAMLAVFQIQDLIGSSEKLRRENPQDERINDPANSESSWRYRMHLTLEELMNEHEFNDTLREYIRQSGR